MREARVLAVTFDLEGTCVDLEQSHFLAFELTMREFGHRITVAELQALPGAIGGGDPHIAATLSRRCDVSVPRVVETKNRHFDRLVSDLQLTPRLGVVEAIEYAKSLGCAVAVGSLTPRSRGQQILERSGLGTFFQNDLTVFREDVEHPKPNPDVYIETARRMEVSPIEQLVFEDSVPGVKAAVAAGSHVVAVPATISQKNGYPESLRQAKAHHVYMGWDEVRKVLSTLLA